MGAVFSPKLWGLLSSGRESCTDQQEWGQWGDIVLGCVESQGHLQLTQIPTDERCRLHPRHLWSTLPSPHRVL